MADSCSTDLLLNLGISCNVMIMSDKNHQMRTPCLLSGRNMNNSAMSFLEKNALNYFCLSSLKTIANILTFSTQNQLHPSLRRFFFPFLKPAPYFWLISTVA